MKLELRRINIKDIQLGNETKVENGVLTINEEELVNELKKDERVKDVKLDIARPGEKNKNHSCKRCN